MLAVRGLAAIVALSRLRGRLGGARRLILAVAEVGSGTDRFYMGKKCLPGHSSYYRTVWRNMMSSSNFKDA